MKLLHCLFTVIILESAWGCEPTPSKPPSQVVEAKRTEANQQRLAQSVPLPILQTSLERKNLARRLERLNTESLISYIYLISQTGKLMAFYTVDGKVTSLNAYLTADYVQTRHYEGAVVETQLPDLDGAYGKNPDGIFFFTTEGVYVEWFGSYLWSDQPLKLTQQPELLYQVKK
jgi:hypothetical protein